MFTTALAQLTIASALSAPALPPRKDWAGESTMIRRSSIPCGNIEADGTFTPTGTLRGIEYQIIKEQSGRLMVNQDGKNVWVEKADMIRLFEAAEHFTAMIDKEPMDARWHMFRGWAFHRTGKDDRALQDMSESIRLHPEAAHWYNNRGLVYSRMKKYEEAVADFSRAIELAPTDPLAIRNRATNYNRMGKHDKAIADYEKAVQLAPDNPFTRNGLAWLLCTVPNDKFRDGKRAIEHALKACELTEYKNAGYVDTLAAAYAEAGQWDKAVELQEKAIKSGEFPLKDLTAAKKRLELFKDKKPYREEKLPD